MQAYGPKDKHKSDLSRLSNPESGSAGGSKQDGYFWSIFHK